MKLIIDIPDEYFEQIKNNTEGSTAESEAVNAIRSGMPYEENLQEDLISRDALKHKFAQITYIRFTADMGQGGYEMFSEKEIEDIINKASSVGPEKSQGKCKTCRYRDPEDKKCDCGGQERQGCPFPVRDNYFCKFYEKGGAE